MLGCLLDRARGANKKNLQNSVQCGGADRRCHLRAMDGEEKTHSVDSGEEYDVDGDKDSTGPGEKNDDLLIEEAYLTLFYLP